MDDLLHRSSTLSRPPKKFRWWRATFKGNQSHRRSHSITAENTAKRNHDLLPLTSPSDTANSSIKNSNRCQPMNLRFTCKDHTVNEPWPNTKTPGKTREIIHISTTEPSFKRVNETKTSFYDGIARAPKRVCDLLEKLKSPSPGGVLISSQWRKATDNQSDIARLRATIGEKAIKWKVDTRERTFPEENFVEPITYSLVTPTKWFLQYILTRKELRKIWILEINTIMPEFSLYWLYATPHPTTIGDFWVYGHMTANHPSVFYTQEHSQT